MWLPMVSSSFKHYERQLTSVKHGSANHSLQTKPPCRAPCAQHSAPAPAAPAAPGPPFPERLFLAAVKDRMEPLLSWRSNFCWEQSWSMIQDGDQHQPRRQEQDKSRRIRRRVRYKVGLDWKKKNPLQKTDMESQ